jgi:nucleoside-diphosphate-sugar epimerase
VKVFLAGATGVIGRRLVPLLVGAGHVVVGMTRSPERAAALRQAGVEPAVCDVFDADAVRRAVAAAAPDVVLHELTDLPANLGPRNMKAAYARNDRVRTEGTRNLVDAAAAAGVGRMIAQSIAFAYRPEGGMVKSEDAPLWDDAPEPFTGSVAALHVLEDAVTRTDGIAGLVLRYGWFYGPGTAHATDGGVAAMVRKRRFPVLGRGTGTFSYIHVDDAAAATVAALERGGTGVLNVVDDEPAPISEWLPVYAEALGAPAPRRLPVFVGRLVAGKLTATMAQDLRGASNARAKQALGWEPRWASWRQGFREALG